MKTCRNCNGPLPCKPCTLARQARWQREKRPRGPRNLPANANELITFQRDELLARIAALCHVNPDSGCREWISAKQRKGYGMIFVNLAGIWYQIGAHRIIAALFHGLDLRDRHRLACHHCDNRCCTEPTHVFNGSHLDNQLDAQQKGRLRGNTKPGPRPKGKAA